MTLCGELAGRTISALALIGLGFRSISMSPASIGPVKAMLCETPVGELGELLAPALRDGMKGSEVRNKLQTFADRHGIPL